MADIGLGVLQGMAITLRHFFSTGLDHLRRSRRVVAFDGALQPGAPHHGWSSDLWPIVAWTVAGLVVATRRFGREAAD